MLLEILIAYIGARLIEKYKFISIPYDTATIRVHDKQVTNTNKKLIDETNKTNLEIFLAGGQILRKTNSTYGPDVISFINNITCDLVFFSCKGLSSDGKITEANNETKAIKAAMIKNAKTKVLLIDSSKFNKRFMLTTCELKDIDYIITDKMPSEEIIKICKESNTTLLC